MEKSQKRRRRVTITVLVASVLFVAAVGISIYISGAFRVFMGPADDAAQISDTTEQKIVLEQKLSEANSDALSEDYTPVFIVLGCMVVAAGILVFVLPRQAKKRKGQ